MVQTITRTVYLNQLAARCCLMAAFGRATDANSGVWRIYDAIWLDKDNGAKVKPLGAAASVGVRDELAQQVGHGSHQQLLGSLLLLAAARATNSAGASKMSARSACVGIPWAPLDGDTSAGAPKHRKA
eukprot:s1345_g4.t1